MELTRFQKIILAVLAGMLVLFGALMAAFRARPGVTFEEGLLRIAEEEGRTVYSGRAQGEPVTIAVSWPTNFETDVEFTIGSRFHDVCTVLYPTEKIPTEDGYTVNGIRVTKNGEVLFEGGYDPENEFGWYGKDGAWDPTANISMRAYAGGDPWSGYETTAGTVTRFAFGPETAARGEPAIFALAVFLSLILVADVLFHKQLFRWRHWAARDPEPTEDYLALERIGWVLLAVIIAGVYVAALVNIY